MSKEEEIVWGVSKLDSAQIAGKPITVESFLVSKLGVSAGKRLFKELLTIGKDLTKSVTGKPVINLTAKGGEFVSVEEIS
jgi:hypothetical protein